MTQFNLWLSELKRVTKERLKSLTNHDVITSIKVEQFKKYRLIYINNIERFAVSDLDNNIYSSKNSVINKKHCYGSINTWEEWDWSSYYPYRKDLYKWENMKGSSNVSGSKKKNKKAARTLERFNMAETMQGQAWPYTKGTREETRNNTGDDPQLGKQQIPNPRNGSKNKRNLGNND